MTPRKRLNILLADDGSQHARAAVELLQHISLPQKSKIFVFRAFNSGQIPLIPEMERSLEQTQASLANAGFAAETELHLGPPVEAILARAHDRKSALIVMGAKGLRSTVSILLGGVAQNVVEHAHCPVLVVRASCQGIHKILLAIDGSPPSVDAARYLGKFPPACQGEVHIMHVLPPALPAVTVEPYFGPWQAVYVGYPSLQQSAALRKKETKAGEALLERICRLLRGYGVASTKVLARGDAATEIMDYVQKHQIDLVVVGSRGLGQIKGLVMGSVSRKLIHYSGCSVLVVRTPGKE